MHRSSTTKNDWERMWTCQSSLSLTPLTGSQLCLKGGNLSIEGAVVVPHVTERLLPIQEVWGLNPVIGTKLYWTFIYCDLYWKEDNKDKRGRECWYLNSFDKLMEKLVHWSLKENTFNIWFKLWMTISILVWTVTLWSSKLYPATKPVATSSCFKTEEG